MVVKTSVLLVVLMGSMMGAVASPEQWLEAATNGLMQSINAPSHTERTRDWCGCNPNKMLRTSRNGIGHTCERNGDSYDEETCGSLCQDPDSKSVIVHFCPPGYTTDCGKGCVLDKDDFEDNLEHALVWLLKKNPEAFLPNSTDERKLKCGCEWGTAANLYQGYGFGDTSEDLDAYGDIARYCKRAPSEYNPGYDKKLCGPVCGVFGRDREGKDFKAKSIWFCPEGFVSDCREGCKMPKMKRAKRMKFFEDLVLSMAETNPVNVPKVYSKQLDRCGCNKAMAPKKITWGTNVGHFCIRAPNGGYGDECGPVCQWESPKGETYPIMSICPDGFEPSCSGCRQQNADL